MLCLQSDFTVSANSDMVISQDELKKEIEAWVTEQKRLFRTRILACTCLTVQSHE